MCLSVGSAAVVLWDGHGTHGKILLELKSQARTKNDEAQMLNYLKASGLRVGMLINFVCPKAQIKRLIM